MDDDISYRQFKQPFVGNLSIIDVMMFNDAEALAALLQRYSLHTVEAPVQPAVLQERRRVPRAVNHA